MVHLRSLRINNAHGFSLLRNVTPSVLIMKKVAKAVVIVAIFAAGMVGGLFLRLPYSHRASQASRVLSVKPELASFIKRAVLIRALGIEAPDRILSVLDRMPAGVLPRDAKSVKARLALWSLFFKGTMTELGRLSSPDPLILYYNPIDDVGLLLGCRYSPKTGKPSCEEACAFPGEAMQGAQPFQMPPWLLETQPFAAFLRNGDLRLATFVHAEPPKGKFSTAWPKTYCAPQLQAAAEARLLASAHAMAHLNAHQLQAAVVRYLKAHGVRNSHGDSAPKRNSSVGRTVGLMLNLADYSLSAGLPLPHQKWVVFLTPRVNGWGDAALLLDQNRSGSLSVRGTRFFAFSTHGG